MSIELSKSHNYIWNTHCDVDFLGEGTFGKVYRGIDKKTGARVAIKTFKYVNHQVLRETGVLQSLKHQYIIQLIAVERDELSKNTIMVLEMCNGGSLMSFLNETANVCGLIDHEFLLVLEHLSGGLNYLKNHNVIHRDVKPDNIMRHVTDDGRTIYKLADFGAARELPEGENFSSLHGTEPYLNPDLFRMYFHPEAASCKKFGPDTDLWSIGVTLYQIATGNLPFPARDRRIMLRIYDEMRQTSGIIAASKKSNSDEVVFKNELPQNCRLSAGLRQLVTPLIAGLFVQNPTECWSFSGFYDEQFEIVSKKLILVFCVNKMQVLRVYLRKDEIFINFKKIVAVQSGVSEDSQVFLYEQSIIVDNFEDFPPMDGGVVFMFDKNSNDISPTVDIHLNFDKLSHFLGDFKSSDNADNLVSYVNRDLCLCKNLMEYQNDAYNLTVSFIKNFRSYCKSEMREERKLNNNLTNRNSSIMSKVKILEKIQDMSEISLKLNSVNNTFIDNVSYLFDDGKEEALNLDLSHGSCLSTVLKLLTEIKPLTISLNNAAQVNPHLYNYEKMKLVHSIQTIVELFVKKMDPNFGGFVRRVTDWYNSEFLTQIRILRNLKIKLNRYKCELDRLDDEVCQIAENFAPSTRVNTIVKDKMRQILAQYKQNSVDAKSILEENLVLVNRMDNLFLDMDFNLGNLTTDV